MHCKGKENTTFLKSSVNMLPTKTTNEEKDGLDWGFSSQQCFIRSKLRAEYTNNQWHKPILILLFIQSSATEFVLVYVYRQVHCELVSWMGWKTKSHQKYLPDNTPDTLCHKTHVKLIPPHHYRTYANSLVLSLDTQYKFVWGYIISKTSFHGIIIFIKSSLLTYEIIGFFFPILTIISQQISIEQCCTCYFKKAISN